MINAIALDDEPLALKVIENFCQQVEYVQLQRSFTRPSEAKKYLRKFPVDLIFLDIQMPSLSGIDFCKTIPQNTMVVFVTAHSEYAVEGFNLSALDYLLKPFTMHRFKQAMQKAREYHQFLTDRLAPEINYIFVRADYNLIKIDLADILLIEGCDDYIKIVLKGDKKVVARMTMKAIQERLPSGEFVRIHRSYIVAVNKIERIHGRNILINSKEIPVGNSYEANLQHLLGH